MKKQKNTQGFTLIEIMVVVVILGVLGALIVPNVLGRSGQARVAAATSDINALANALEIYYLDNRHYPSTDQGIEALVKKPSGSPEPSHWNKAGYIKKLPKDPWGKEYLYISPGKNSDFDLYSLGSDGKDGGKDDDADIIYAEL